MVFGYSNKNGDKCKINEIELENVKSYKYLGIYFSTNGTFKETRKHLSQQAKKAMNIPYQRIYNLTLPLDICLKLFDRTITPILVYSSEIWGYENTDIIENIHTEFLRKI